MTDTSRLPTISVIVPMYNEAENVQNTVTRIVSILNEHYESWELLVVDDGSTDSTLAIAQESALKNPRVRIFHHPRNLGPVELLEPALRTQRAT